MMIVAMYVVSTEIGTYTDKTVPQFICNVIGIKNF